MEHKSIDGVRDSLRVRMAAVPRTRYLVSRCCIAESARSVAAPRRKYDTDLDEQARECPKCDWSGPVNIGIVEEKNSREESVGTRQTVGLAIDATLMGIWELRAACTCPYEGPDQFTRDLRQLRPEQNSED